MMSALRDLEFPKSKSKILNYAKGNKNISEGSNHNPILFNLTIF